MRRKNYKMKERGMMKWQPFTSIVEQQQAINEVLEEFSKVEQPILDQSQHEENAKALLAAYYSQQPIILTYYERGHIVGVEGSIYRINEPYRYFIIQIQEKLNKKIAFDSLIQVQIKG